MNKDDAFCEENMAYVRQALKETREKNGDKVVWHYTVFENLLARVLKENPQWPEPTIPEYPDAGLKLECKWAVQEINYYFILSLGISGPGNSVSFSVQTNKMDSRTNIRNYTPEIDDAFISSKLARAGRRLIREE